ncbi:MAG: AAA family ATPase [Haloglomus sp.]
MAHDWNIITAGPSAGKSSTIRELSARGYRTGPEAARILFDQCISEGGDPEQLRRADDFHEQVEAIDLRIESNLSEEVTFLDRSLADNIAYRRHFDNPVPDELFERCRGRYDNVLLLERIRFRDDEVRSEDEAEARELHGEIRAAYRDLGYDVTDVPLMPVDERADFIEEIVFGE